MRRSPRVKLGAAARPNWNKRPAPATNATTPDRSNIPTPSGRYCRHGTRLDLIESLIAKYKKQEGLRADRVPQRRELRTGRHLSKRTRQLKMGK